MGFCRVASLDEIPLGTLTEIVQGESVVAICNVAGDVRALSGVCPHLGGPLGQGSLDGDWITCPWHMWVFHSKTGVSDFNSDLRIAVYPVRFNQGEILVDLP